MLHLYPNSSKVIQAKKEFHDGMLDFVFKRIDKISKIKNLTLQESIQLECFFDIVLIEHLDDILIGKPERLIEINDILTPFIKNNSVLIKGIQYVFNYDTFISKAKIRYDAYNLAESLDCSTCTYCNRNYTNTIVTENGTKITRPQFDHFFDKGTHPLLALSFFNLIPSCSICNSVIKGSREMNLNDHLHPYLDNEIDNFRFSYQYTVREKSRVRVKIIAPRNSKIRNTIEVFEVEEIYNSNKDELLDLIKTKKYFSDRYLSILSKNLLEDVISSKEELYRIAFGTEINSENFIKRPFSKFKKDILKELGII